MEAEEAKTPVIHKPLLPTRATLSHKKKVAEKPDRVVTVSGAAWELIGQRFVFQLEI